MHLYLVCQVILPALKEVMLNGGNPEKPLYLLAIFDTLLYRRRSGQFFNSCGDGLEIIAFIVPGKGKKLRNKWGCDLKKTGFIFVMLFLFGCLFEHNPPDRSGIIGKWVYDDSSEVAQGIVNFRYKVYLTIDEKNVQYDLYFEKDGFKDGFDGTWSLKDDVLTLHADTCYLPDSAGVKKHGDCGFYHSTRRLILFWDGAFIYSEVDGRKYPFKKE